MSGPRESGEIEVPIPEDLPADVNQTFDLHRTRAGRSWSAGKSFEALALRSALVVPDPASPRFTLRALLAEGGFGEVWVASQNALRRTVAVKKSRETLRKQLGANRAALEEMDNGLLQEALLLATLDHPGIAPIYDLVCEEDGTPALAMKLVRGRPWKELLAADHAGLQPDEYLSRHVAILVAVSQAVAFAHSKGIVHLDIKPSQVMVGEFGEVFLVDWGLAMVFDEDRALQQGIEHLWGLPTRVSASSPRGTVAFMAPEQTANTAAGLGPWTDVFLLGGTLYLILSGDAPYGKEADTHAAFRRAARGDISPLEGASRPRELMELCGRALASDPARRLESVEAFIEALQAFQTGANRRREAEAFVRDASAVLSSATSYKSYEEGLEGLERAKAVWPETPQSAALRETALAGYSRLALQHGDLKLARVQAERMPTDPAREALLRDISRREEDQARHARQRKIALVLCGLLLAALVVASYQYAVWTRRARLRAETARSQADGLIQYMLGDLYDQLEPLGQSRILKKAGEKALDYFDGLPAEDIAGSNVLRRALVLHQVGRVQEASGNSAEAIRTLVRSIDTLESLVEDPGHRREARVSLVAVYKTLSDVLRRNGKGDDALVLIQKQEKLLAEALREQPGDAELLANLATTNTAAGRLFLARGDLESARSWLEKGLSLREELSRKDPASLKAKRDVSIAHNELGRTLLRQGQLTLAREHLEKALAVVEELAAREPQNQMWRRGLGISHDDLGNLLLAAGDLAGAAKHIELTQQLARELHERDPENAEWFSNLATSWRSVGDLRLSAGDPAGAEKAYEAFETPSRTLHEKEPGNWTWRLLYGSAQLCRAEALIASGRTAEGEAKALAARKLFEESTTGEPGKRARGIGQAFLLEAEVLAREGKSDAARTAFEKAGDALDKADTSEFSAKVLRIRVALGLGKKAEAETLARVLVDAGFREGRFMKLVAARLPELAKGR